MAFRGTRVAPLGSAACRLHLPVSDAVSEVDNPDASDDVGVVEQYGRVSEFAEEADAPPEQDGREFDGDFVHQVQVECLLDDVGTG
jgi:hypothetical protein